MELWDVYDVDRIPTGRLTERGCTPKPGDYHLAVHICVIRSDGKMLIQQRQPFKQGFPGLWDITTGGSSVAGENSRQAAEREVFEELGLKLDLSKTRPAFTINYSHGFDDFYIVEAQPELDSLSLQYEEVKDAAWAGQEEILSMLDSGVFVPYRRPLIELIFNMAGSTGAWAE